eukprot:COSAG01_NODE_14037_length_1504_cov_1.223488_2_plen_81_part_00
MIVADVLWPVGAPAASDPANVALRARELEFYYGELFTRARRTVEPGGGRKLLLQDPRLHNLLGFGGTPLSDHMAQVIGDN